MNLLKMYVFSYFSIILIIYSINKLILFFLFLKFLERFFFDNLRENYKKQKRT